MKEQPSINVLPEHLRIVRDILRKYVPDRTVWVFGSRVTGRAKKFSDLDLMILGDSPLGIALQAEIAEAFSESDLPWKVDLLDWVLTSAEFRALIEREKIVLQEATTKRSAT